MLRFMNDLVIQAETRSALLTDIPVIAASVLGAVQLTPDGEIVELDHQEAASAISKTPHLMVNAPMVARRVGLRAFRAYDLLELYAFARPARFCLPTLPGLMEALTLTGQADRLEDQLMLMRDCAIRLLADLSGETYRYRAGAGRVAMEMAKGGWCWGPLALGALEIVADHSREDGLAVWSALDDFEDQAPPPPSGDDPVSEAESTARLQKLLGSSAEDRPAQVRYAGAATHAFRPREFEAGPNIQLLEAGTGTGKTLGYIAPASVWAEKNNVPVWLSTYTKNLQRQLDQELAKLYPDPRIKAKRAVIRKGRENYACLLNIEETLRAVMGRGGNERDRTLMGLVVRWARFSRDGDMIGGDFPSWLGAHFGAGRIAGLTDRRGECLYSACQHYRKCFVEKTVRRSKHADLVVANHALVMSQAVSRAGDPDLPSRLVFDEGHHVFDAADSAFSANLSGMEGVELRRWLRGKESGGSTRARGLQSRIDELVADDDEAKNILHTVILESRILPAVSWMERISGAAPMGAFETFLMLVRAQVMARADTRGVHAIECGTHDPSGELVEAADDLAKSLDMLARPMIALATKLMAKLDDESEILETSSRGRLESAARSLRLRAETVSMWRQMAASTGSADTVSDTFVDWFEVDRFDGRERDIGFHRHFVDPTKPFAEVVLGQTAGAVITSATLRDKIVDQGVTSGAEDWKVADIRTGSRYLDITPKRLTLSSPFDYANNTKVIVVGDVNKNDPDQVAAAYRALFLASGGGALGLFTAISRLRATWHAIAPDLESMGLNLYAQHVDPVDTATLVDIFRAEVDSSLLGTDAVRDGVDVPGHSLRLMVCDRVPWPRPNLLHRARRAAFGGKAYDEMLTRMKLLQAYGRLIRRADDRGVFVVLDGATPTRLLDALPDGVTPIRTGLADAVALVKDFTA